MADLGVTGAADHHPVKDLLRHNAPCPLPVRLTLLHPFRKDDMPIIRVTDLGPRKIMFAPIPEPIINRDPGDENDAPQSWAEVVAIGRRVRLAANQRDQSVPCPMCLGDNGTQYGCEFCPENAYPRLDGDAA